MLKQVILYRHQYDLCCYFTPFWKMKSKAGQYGWEKNIFSPLHVNKSLAILLPLKLTLGDT